MSVSPATTAPDAFAVHVRPAGTTVTATVHGELDLTVADELKAALAGALRLRPVPETLVVDLGAVAFLDSSAVHVLLAIHRRAVARGVRLVIAPAAPAVQRVFALCLVDDVLPFAGGPAPGG
jgi:anti-sigma B factor antagonist